MTGILETMKAQLDATVQEVQALKTAIAALQAGGAPAAPAAAAPAADPFAAFGAPAAPAKEVTAEAITALIQPHLDNDKVRDALGVEMRAMGISALPDTQPGQYAELYARFQRVIAAAGTAGATTTPASIV
jgi:hypothetical protein